MPGNIRQLAVLLAASLLVPAPAAAGKKCDTGGCEYLKCVVERTLCLVEAGDAQEALDLLLEEQDKFEGYRDYHLLVARAHIALDDTAGALGTLDAFIADHPKDCTARAWLAWVYIDHGFTELTAEILDDEECSGGSGPLALRYALLGTYLDIKNDEASSEEFGELEVEEIYEEDIQLLRYARSVLAPQLAPPFTIRAGFQGGYVTNAMFGSPQDPAFAGKEMGSPILAHQLLVAIAPMATRWLSPRIELSSNSSIFLFEEESRMDPDERAAHTDPLDFTSFDFGVRTGLTFMKPTVVFPSAFVGYRGDVLFLNMEDLYDKTPPVAFYEGHRLEIELSPLPSAVLFGGFGRRLFREDIRTRWEVDAGIGLHRGVTSWLTLLGAASIRNHWAEHDKYDLFGVSVLGSAVFSIWRGIQLKTLVALHMDKYPSSRGLYSLPDVTRRDITVKVSGELMTMSFKGIRFSAIYEFSDKISSIPEYEFMDHRVMGKISIFYGFDFLGAKASADDHIPLDYGLEFAAAGEAEGIQDLLRTDEHVRGGPGCGCME